MQIDEKLQEIVSEIHHPVGEPSMTSSPSELGFDSLDMVELGTAIEDEFDLELPDEKLMEFADRPLNELARYIEGEVEHGV